MKKILWITLLVVVCLSGLASASIDRINYPYENQILTSPAVDLNFDTTASTSCFWTYHHPTHNYTIACGGDKIRLPSVEGNYNLTIGDDTGDIKSVQVTLDYPSGLIVALFSVLFIGVCFALTGLLLMSIFRAISLDMDAKDLALNLSAYFSLVAIYFLGLEYLGNPSINSILLSFMQVGGVTNVFVPMVAFFVTFFKKKGRLNENG